MYLFYLYSSLFFGKTTVDILCYKILILLSLFLFYIIIIIINLHIYLICN